MNLFEETKAQTSIEYLLMLGGIILVAAIIGLVLKNTATGIKEDAVKTAN